METIGRILKENRIKKNLTIHEISVVTKINSRIIKAIEEGNLEELPSKSFLRGFVRSYASYLKIDVDKILRTFQEELGSTLYEPSYSKTQKKNSKIISKKSSPPKKTVQSRSLWSYVFWSFLTLSVVYFILVVRGLVEKYKQESLVNWSSKGLKKIENLKDEKELPLNALNSKEEFEKEKILNRIEKKQAQNLKSSIKLKTLEKNQPSHLNETKTEGDKKPSILSHEVILEAIENVQVSFLNLRSQKKIDWLLLKNQTHIIKSSDPFHIVLEKGGVINVIYNGKDKGILGKKEKSLTLKYP